jgi:hypothetical protein
VRIIHVVNPPFRWGTDAVGDVVPGPDKRNPELDTRVGFTPTDLRDTRKGRFETCPYNMTEI